MNAKAKAKTAPAPKLTLVPDDVLAPGTEVKFLGYTEGTGKLKAGTSYFIGTYFSEEKIYNVSKTEGGKVLDSVLRDEVEVVEPEGSGLLVNVDDAPAEEKVKPEKPAKPAKAAKAAKAAKEEAPAAPTAPAPLVIPTGSVRVLNSVKEAIKEAGSPLAAASALFEKVEGSYITLGGILAVVQEKDAHSTLLDAEGLPLYEAGQKGFAAYVERTLGMKYRKAQYLVTTYLTITALGIPESKLAGIGWSKIKEALGYLQGGGNIEECLRLAKAEPFDQFKASIRKKMVAEGITQHGNTGGSSEMTTYKVVVHNDQATLLDAALALAAQQLDVTNPAEDPTTLGQCVMHMVTEWYNQATAE